MARRNSSLIQNQIQLQHESVTSDKIANDAVGANQLANNSVDSDALQNSAVSTDKIADGAITTNKLDAGIDLGGVTTGKAMVLSIIFGG